MLEPPTQIEKHYAAWVERCARFGYAAKCFVDVLVGAIAARTAFFTSSPEGSEDALSAVANEPFGKIILVLVAIVGVLAWYRQIEVR